MEDHTSICSVMELKKAYYIATIGNRGEKAGGCKPLGKAKERKHQPSEENSKAVSLYNKVIARRKNTIVQRIPKSKRK